jgi:hypothetical protein
MTSPSLGASPSNRIFEPQVLGITRDNDVTFKKFQAFSRNRKSFFNFVALGFKHLRFIEICLSFLPKVSFMVAMMKRTKNRIGIKSTRSLLLIVYSLWSLPLFALNLDQATLEELKKEAEQGNVVAQSLLGQKYEEGEGVKRNPRQAFEWYQKAAEQGDLDSQCRLGEFYGIGLINPQDFKKSAEWYRKAAEQGSAIAQHNLGVAYSWGTAEPRDYKQALRWFQKAAEQGLVRAQCNLGILYANGLGVEKSLYLAKKWFQKASDQGSTDAARVLIQLKKSGSKARLSCPSLPKSIICGPVGRYGNRSPGGC